MKKKHFEISKLDWRTRKVRAKAARMPPKSARRQGLLRALRVVPLTRTGQILPPGRAGVAVRRARPGRRWRLYG